MGNRGRNLVVLRKIDAISLLVIKSPPMSKTQEQTEKKHSEYAFNLTLAAIAGQVGCLTMVIILAALFGGLWLDSRLGTKPMFTIGLLFISIPITLLLMFWVVKAATSRLQTGSEQKPAQTQTEEGNDQ